MLDELCEATRFASSRWLTDVSRSDVRCSAEYDGARGDNAREQNRYTNDGHADPFAVMGKTGGEG